MGRNYESKRKIILGVVYRRPNTIDNVSSALFWEISKACRQGNIYILGDLIYNNIDREFLVGDSEAERYSEIVQDDFLKSHVNKPMLCDNEKLVRDLEVIGK